MDDIDDSPSSPHSPPSARITVTVAATSSPSTTINNHLTLALPIQNTPTPPPPPSSSGGREDCWTESATSALIDAWGERYLQLSRGNLKQKHWQEVSHIVSYSHHPKTDIQCKNRIDTVKKKYKIEKSKPTPSSWPFFSRLDCLLAHTPTTNNNNAKVVAVSVSPALSSAGNSQKVVPVGIPVGVRPLPLPISAHLFPPQSQPQQHYPQLQYRQQMPPMLSKFATHNYVNTNSITINSNNSNITGNNCNSREVRRGLGMEVASEEESEDSLPPPTRGQRKRRRGGEWGRSVRELTKAILKFGEAYEAAESAKLEQIVEMEKQRMRFAKELELQRMEFLMKTQLKLSQLNDIRAGGGDDDSDSHGGGGGGKSNQCNNHGSEMNHANSDASN